MPDIANTTRQYVRELKRYDERRDDFPGEHIIVLAAGAFLIWSAGRRRSMLTRMAMTAVGGALVGRAASGRGGVAKIAGLMGRR